MKNSGIKNPNADLTTHGIQNLEAVYWNLSPEELVEASIEKGYGVLADSGALVIQTGEFTGRSPQDRFIVEDDITQSKVNWGKINKPFDSESYNRLYHRVCRYLEGKTLYVRDAYACADKKYQMNLRVVTEFPWSNQFAYNMFRRPDKTELLDFVPEWTVICAPGFMADPEIDGTRQHNFAILNFSKKQILIGGTGYTGEIKKGIFSALNFLLPVEHNVLPMHCSANVGQNEDTAIFFGLSGTGKTTLSADAERKLIGDDEHGWSDDGVFNFEGGCYAKTIDLSKEKEPEIYRAIRNGAILENISFFEGTRTPDYENGTITENTRVSYPLEYIENVEPSSAGGHPEHIFFLTCDAFGVLPPISKLTPEQAMYYFISGYTAKVAGTEAGVDEPQATFSACFGAPFLPLHPTVYAEMLGEKMKQHKTRIWLVNTGWSGGAFGEGARIKLTYTRAMIKAALNGDLALVPYVEHEVFGLQMPTCCPGVPDGLLDPRKTWSRSFAYDEKANELATAFVRNFEQFADKADEKILEAAPKVLAY